MADHFDGIQLCSINAISGGEIVALTNDGEASGDRIRPI